MEDFDSNNNLLGMLSAYFMLCPEFKQTHVRQYYYIYIILNITKTYYVHQNCIYYKVIRIKQRCQTFGTEIYSVKLCVCVRNNVIEAPKQFI